MRKFKAITPDNINELSIAEVLQYVPEKQDGLPSARVRLNYIKMLYEVLGLTLTPDNALATLAEPTALLTLAIAGGGKTTWAQTKAILQKLIRPSKRHPDRKIEGSKILCLVYNNHNVRDMKERHAQLVNRLMLAGIDGIKIDSDINATTMHAFCDFWRKEYIAKLDLLGCRLLDSPQLAQTLMNRAIKMSLAKGDFNVKEEDI